MTKTRLRLGTELLYFNDTFREPEVPRLAKITGFGPRESICLHVFRHPTLDAGESSVLTRENVKLLEPSQSPDRTMRDWCRLGEFGPGAEESGGIPIAEDDPEVGFTARNPEDDE
jgi:hypothetical protein